MADWNLQSNRVVRIYLNNRSILELDALLAFSKGFMSPRVS